MILQGNGALTFVRGTTRKELDPNHLWLLVLAALTVLSLVIRAGVLPQCPCEGSLLSLVILPQLTLMSCMSLRLKNSFPQSYFECVSS